MKKLLRRILCCLSLLGVLIAVLGTTISVRADDGVPTSPETPVPVVTEEPIATESPTQEPVVPESELPVAADASMEESPVQEAAPMEVILASIPEETDVLVLNESGSPEPLASQAAADTLLLGDPMWCPAGVAPVASTGGCTASHTSFESLLLYLSANEPGQAGVIWIAKDYDSGIHDASITSFTLDGSANFPTMSNFDLRFQGGWNGDNAGTILGNDPSEFNATLNIVNWNANVSLSDILFTETNGPGMNVSPAGIVPSSVGAGLAVTTTGNVNLNNVDSTSNNSNGVLIDNRSGSSAVSITDGSFSGNGTGNGGLGIYVLSKGPITLNNVIANENSWEGGKFFNDTVTGSQGDVTLKGTNIFNNNGMDGLMISSMGDINLNNLNVSGNGLTGAYINNANGTGNVTFTGMNTFNNNVGTGMYVYSDGVITIHGVTATGNGMEGAVLLNGLYGPSNKIVFTGTNIFQGNSGLYPDGYPDLHIGLDNDFAQYTNVTIHGHITLQPLQIDQLPENLPEGTSFVAALQVLEIGEEVVISFCIPDGMQDAELKILYWDDLQWLDLETAVFEDGRLVKDSGHKTENGYFQATVNFGGVFVLVQK